MSEYDRTRWERKHLEQAAVTPGAPLPSLRLLPRATSGATALDLACGRGRHCGALLAAGYRVAAVDVSAVGLAAVRRLYGDAGGQLTLIQADLDQWPFRKSAFDLILQCDFLARARFDDIKASTKTGGLVLIDTFRRGSREAGPHNPAYLLEAGELLTVFAGWEIVGHEVDESASAREAILVRKPGLRR